VRLDPKRISIFVGHYGSGKTEVSINYALAVKRLREKVTIVDLDIVNPYYRTKDAQAVLEAGGVRLMSSEFANTNVDIPSLPVGTNSLFDDREAAVIMDVGGDDDGAIVLGSLQSRIEAERYDMFYVFNERRLLTCDAASALEYMRDIEQASRLKVTGIINNTNLAYETDEETVLRSLPAARELSELSGVPVVMTSVREDIASGLEGRVENLFPIKINIKHLWL